MPPHVVRPGMPPMGQAAPGTAPGMPSRPAMPPASAPSAVTKPLFPSAAQVHRATAWLGFGTSLMSRQELFCLGLGDQVTLFNTWAFGGFKLMVKNWWHFPVVYYITLKGQSWFVPEKSIAGNPNERMVSVPEWVMKLESKVVLCSSYLFKGIC